MYVTIQLELRKCFNLKYVLRYKSEVMKDGKR